jgi:hypothetical protein
MRLVVFIYGFGLAGAQFAGHGVSKSTYAAQRDPLGGMAFIQKYFGAYATAGPCDGDICNCTAGESEAESDWPAYQGRTQLLREGDSWGECLLRTSSSGPTSTEKVGGLVHFAVVASPYPGVQCEFVRQSEMPAADGDEGYAVPSLNLGDCCKACAAVETCVGATFTWNTTQPPPLPGFGFGLHLPGITEHLTTGGLSVQDVEGIFSDKNGDMTEFDSFMDFNVGLFTADIDYYLKKLSADGVPYLAANWSNSSGTDGNMYSVFVHVPNSQMIIELIGASSDILAADPKLFGLEQRVSDPAMEAIWESPPTGQILKAVKVSRAATDLDALDAFYVDGMRTQTVLSLNGHDVSARCYQWPGATTDVCFVKRSPSDTKGDFKVGDFELMLQNVFDTIVTNPYCLMNRWEDNHYAYDAPIGSDMDFDYIATYLDDHPSSKYICTAWGLHYIFDPTGWAVQLDIDWTKQPSGCNLTLPEPDIQSAFCGGGICEAYPPELSPAPP